MNGWRAVSVKALIVTLLATIGSACTNDTPASVGASERYRYTAEQRTPFVAAQTGVLTVTPTGRRSV